MANIEKRTTPTGKTTYRAKVRIKGFPVQSATFDKLAAAKSWGATTEAALREGRHFKGAEAKRRTLNEALDKYIGQVLPNKPKSQGSQLHQLHWWKENLGSYSLAEITPALIAESRDQLAQGKTHRGLPRGPATVHHYLAALSHVFTMAVKEWGWLEHSPLSKVTKPKLPAGRVRYLSDDERTRLLKVCKESSCANLYTIVVLALSTGARKMEILKLRWQDVDLGRGIIILHDTKNGERRILPLVGHALELMMQLTAARRSENDLIFAGHSNLKPLVVRHPWEAALKAAEINNFHFHDLRHSAASYLAMNGASLAEIAEVLGHKTLNMVKRYAHLSHAHTSKVVASMNNRIFGATQT